MEEEDRERSLDLADVLTDEETRFFIGLVKTWNKNMRVDVEPVLTVDDLEERMKCGKKEKSARYELWTLQMRCKFKKDYDPPSLRKKWENLMRSYRKLAKKGISSADKTKFKFFEDMKLLLDTPAVSFEKSSSDKMSYEITKPEQLALVKYLEPLARVTSSPRNIQIPEDCVQKLSAEFNKKTFSLESLQDQWLQMTADFEIFQENPNEICITSKDVLKSMKEVFCCSEVLAGDEVVSRGFKMLAEVFKEEAEKDRKMIAKMLPLFGKALDVAFDLSLVVPWIVKEGKSMDLTPVTLGLLGSSYGAVQFFSSPVAGYWSDTHGRKKVLLAALFLTSLSYMILTFADKTHDTLPMWLVVIALFLGRITAGLFKHSQTLLRAILSESVSRSEKAAIFGRFNAFSNFGFILGSALGGHMASGPRGFYRISLTAAIVFLLNFLLNWVFLEDDEPEEVEGLKKKRGLAKGAESPVELMDYYDLLLVQFFLSLAALTYRANFALVLEDTYGLDSTMIGYIMSFQGIVSAGTGFLSGLVADWVGGAVQRLRLSSLVSLISLIGVTFSPTAGLSVACLVPFCASNSIARIASAEVTAARAPPGLLGSLVGLTTTVTSSARTVAPLIASVVQTYSDRGPGAFGAAFNLVGFLLTFHLAALPEPIGEELEPGDADRKLKAD
ncbi:unnamed protein product [Notodromas monacha]|uniref:Major facilitator superfamily (MFS) profile domain-containing protein n=1 Tax=Notodromas monacha TaxID=399045 RepID=A0A7R9C0Z4_9CRUS|nr:unnamed protein product [Notodromas monacha]CAG0923791.1 unnamed protein product [Notodromas monacha]